MIIWRPQEPISYVFQPLEQASIALDVGPLPWAPCGLLLATQAHSWARRRPRALYPSTPLWRHRTAQVFGVLYTVSKEKHVSPLFVAVRLLLDVLQLWLLIVQPQNGFMVRSGERSSRHLEASLKGTCVCAPCINAMLPLLPSLTHLFLPQTGSSGAC